MTVELRFRSLTCANSQKYMDYPAVNTQTGDRVNAPEAYAPNRKDRPTHLRPDHAIRGIVGFLNEPRSRTMEPDKLKAALQEHVESFISTDPYINPVIAEDGYTYSAEEIKTWWNAPRAAIHVNDQPIMLTSPMTRDPLESDLLIPNLAMRAFMAELGVNVDHDAAPSPARPVRSALRHSVPVGQATLPRPPTPIITLRSTPAEHTAHVGADLHDLDNKLQELAQLLAHHSDSLATRLRRAQRKGSLTASVKRITGSVFQQTGGNISALCRRGADAALLQNDMAEAQRYLDAGLRHDDQNKHLLCRLAYLQTVRPNGSIQAAEQVLAAFFDVAQSDVFSALAAWATDNDGSRSHNWPLRLIYGTMLAGRGQVSASAHYVELYSYGFVNFAVRDR